MYREEKKIKLRACTGVVLIFILGIPAFIIFAKLISMLHFALFPDKYSQPNYQPSKAEIIQEYRDCIDKNKGFEHLCPEPHWVIEKRKLELEYSGEVVKEDKTININNKKTNRITFGDD